MSLCRQPVTGLRRGRPELSGSASVSAWGTTTSLAHAGRSGTNQRNRKVADKGFPGQKFLSILRHSVPELLPVLWLLTFVVAQPAGA